MVRFLQRLSMRPVCTFSAAYLLFAAVQPNAGFSALDLCLARRLLGVPCPTCGLTRGITHLIRFDIVGAIAWHPFAFAALPLLIASTLLLFLNDRHFERACAFSPPKYLPAAWIAALATVAMAVHGAIRALAVYSGGASFPSR